MNPPDGHGDQQPDRSGSIRRTVGRLVQKLRKRKPVCEDEVAEKLNEVESECSASIKGHTIRVFDTLPFALSSELQHDDSAPTYNNGPFDVMEGMTWQDTLVTARRVHRCPNVNIENLRQLQSECLLIGRLRHPNILLLMSLCVTEGPERLVLLYERVEHGSLHEFTHVQNLRLSWNQLCRIVLQICSALQYIHVRGYVHCGLSSHAVQICTSSVAKLSNFQFMQHSDAKSGLVEVTELLEQEFLYNWTAPEVFTCKIASRKSDIYSLSCIVWESFYAEVPWANLKPEEIMSLCINSKLDLAWDEWVTSPFDFILRSGLSQNPDERAANVDKIFEVAKFHLESENSLENSLITLPSSTAQQGIAIGTDNLQRNGKKLLNKTQTKISELSKKGAEPSQKVHLSDSVEAAWIIEGTDEENMYLQEEFEANNLAHSYSDSISEKFPKKCSTASIKYGPIMEAYQNDINKRHCKEVFRHHLANLKEKSRETNDVEEQNEESCGETNHGIAEKDVSVQNILDHPGNSEEIFAKGKPFFQCFEELGEEIPDDQLIRNLKEINKKAINECVLSEANCSPCNKYVGQCNPKIHDNLIDFKEDFLLKKSLSIRQGLIQIHEQLFLKPTGQECENNKMEMVEVSDESPQWEDSGGEGPQLEEHCDEKPQLEKYCDKRPQLEENCDNGPQLEEHCDEKLQLEEPCDNGPQLKEHCDDRPQLEEHCDNEPQMDEHCDDGPKLEEHCDKRPHLEHCDERPLLEEHCDEMPLLEEHCDKRPQLEENCERPLLKEISDGKSQLEEKCGMIMQLEENCGKRPKLEVYHNERLLPKINRDDKHKKEDYCYMKPPQGRYFDEKSQQEEYCNKRPQGEESCNVKSHQEEQGNERIQQEKNCDKGALLEINGDNRVPQEDYGDGKPQQEEYHSNGIRQDKQSNKRPEEAHIEVEQQQEQHGYKKLQLTGYSTESLHSINHCDERTQKINSNKTLQHEENESLLQQGERENESLHQGESSNNIQQQESNNNSLQLEEYIDKRLNNKELGDKNMQQVEHGAETLQKLECSDETLQIRGYCEERPHQEKYANKGMLQKECDNVRPHQERDKKGTEGSDYEKQQQEKCSGGTVGHCVLGAQQEIILQQAESCNKRIHQNKGFNVKTIPEECGNKKIWQHDQNDQRMQQEQHGGDRPKRKEYKEVGMQSSDQGIQEKEYQIQIVRPEKCNPDGLSQNENDDKWASCEGCDGHKCTSRSVQTSSVDRLVCKRSQQNQEINNVQQNGDRKCKNNVLNDSAFTSEELNPVHMVQYISCASLTHSNIRPNSSRASTLSLPSEDVTAVLKNLTFCSEMELSYQHQNKSEKPISSENLKTEENFQENLLTDKHCEQLITHNLSDTNSSFLEDERLCDINSLEKIEINNMQSIKSAHSLCEPTVGDFNEVLSRTISNKFNELLVADKESETKELEKADECLFTLNNTNAIAEYVDVTTRPLMSECEVAIEVNVAVTNEVNTGVANRHLSKTNDENVIITDEILEIMAAKDQDKINITSNMKDQCKIYTKSKANDEDDKNNMSKINDGKNKTLQTKGEDEQHISLRTKDQDEIIKILETKEGDKPIMMSQTKHQNGQNVTSETKEQHEKCRTSKTYKTKDQNEKSMDEKNFAVDHQNKSLWNNGKDSSKFDKKMSVVNQCQALVANCQEKLTKIRRKDDKAIPKAKCNLDDEQTTVMTPITDDSLVRAPCQQKLDNMNRKPFSSEAKISIHNTCSLESGLARHSSLSEHSEHVSLSSGSGNAQKCSLASDYVTFQSFDETKRVANGSVSDQFMNCRQNYTLPCRKVSSFSSDTETYAESIPSPLESGCDNLAVKIDDTIETNNSSSLEGERYEKSKFLHQEQHEEYRNLAGYEGDTKEMVDVDRPANENTRDEQISGKSQASHSSTSLKTPMLPDLVSESNRRLSEKNCSKASAGSSFWNKSTNYLGNIPMKSSLEEFKSSIQTSEFSDETHGKVSKQEHTLVTHNKSSQANFDIPVLSKNNSTGHYQHHQGKASGLEARASARMKGVCRNGTEKPNVGFTKHSQNNQFCKYSCKTPLLNKNDLSSHDKGKAVHTTQSKSINVNKQKSDNILVKGNNKNHRQQYIASLQQKIKTNKLGTMQKDMHSNKQSDKGPVTNRQSIQKNSQITHKQMSKQTEAQTMHHKEKQINQEKERYCSKTSKQIDKLTMHRTEKQTEKEGKPAAKHITHRKGKQTDLKLKNDHQTHTNRSEKGDKQDDEKKFERISNQIDESTNKPTDGRSHVKKKKQLNEEHRMQASTDEYKNEDGDAARDAHTSKQIDKHSTVWKNTQADTSSDVQTRKIVVDKNNLQKQGDARNDVQKNKQTNEHGCLLTDSNRQTDVSNDIQTSKQADVSCDSQTKNRPEKMKVRQSENTKYPLNINQLDKQTTRQNAKTLERQTNKLINEIPKYEHKNAEPEEQKDKRDEINQATENDENIETEKKNDKEEMDKSTDTQNHKHAEKKKDKGTINKSADMQIEKQKNKGSRDKSTDKSQGDRGDEPRIDETENIQNNHGSKKRISKSKGNTTRIKTKDNFINEEIGLRSSASDQTSKIIQEVPEELKQPTKSSVITKSSKAKKSSKDTSNVKNKKHGSSRGVEGQISDQPEKFVPHQPTEYSRSKLIDGFYGIFQGKSSHAEADIITQESSEHSVWDFLNEQSNEDLLHLNKLVVQDKKHEDEHEDGRIVHELYTQPRDLPYEQLGKMKLENENPFKPEQKNENKPERSTGFFFRYARAVHGIVYPWMEHKVTHNFFSQSDTLHSSDDGQTTKSSKKQSNKRKK